MMAKVKLEKYGCIECGEPTTVAMVLPYDGEEDPTGMFIRYMDEEFDEHLIGVICKNCASKLSSEGIIGIGYAGFPHSWDAYYTEEKKKFHEFSFMIKHGIPCSCGKCNPEDEDDDWY